MRVFGALAPCFAERRDRIEHDCGFLDRVDGATESPVGLANLRVPGPAGHRDHAVVRAAARDPGLEAGRLGHDAGVRPQAVLDQRRASRARGLLVRVGRDEQIAVERHPERGQRLDREHHRRDPALHVARPPPVQAPVAHRRDERVARPLRTRLRGHDVDVTVEHQRPPCATPSYTRDQLRPPLERKPGRNQRHPGQRTGVRLPQIHRRPGGTRAARPGTPATAPRRGTDPLPDARSCRTR